MRWLILFGLWLTYVSFGATVASVAPLVSAIGADLGFDHTAIGGLMGAWQLVYIVAAVPAGMLIDRLGGRTALAAGVGLIALSAMGRAWAESYGVFLAAVMVFGLGGPIVSAGSPKIVAGLFTGSARGTAMGIYITGASIGIMAALSLTHPLLMPAFDGDWRAVMRFWGLLSALILLLWLLICAIAGPSVSGLAAMPRGESNRTSALTLVRGITAIGGVRLLLALGIASFMFNHALNNWLPELLRSGGMSATSAGYWAAAPLAVGMVGSLTIPRFATRERRHVIIISLCAMAAVLSLLLHFTHPLLLGPSLFLQGLVRSTTMTVLVLELLELPGMDEAHVGVATGLFFSFAEVGGVLGPLGFGFLHDLSGGFDAGLYALSAIGAMMTLGALRLARTRQAAAIVPDHAHDDTQLAHSSLTE